MPATFLSATAIRVAPPLRPLSGRVVLPGSKSITNRALLLAALAAGTSHLTGALKSDDTERMVDALRERRIEAAGIDVLVQEPPNPDHPLFKLDNVVLAPHNAAAPLECYRKMSLRAVHNILDAIDGKIDPGYVVNPEVLGRNV